MPLKQPPRRVLITKLASMGDLIHLLPALSDAKAAYPSIVFDWVIDKRFQEIATWHPAVDQIIQTDHRTWRSSLLSKKTHTEIKLMAQKMREKDYDLIIDAHGNFKTALLGLLARGPLVGWDGRSTVEWGSHLFYTKGVASPKKAHAIHRLRCLFASALHYTMPTTPPDYQILQNKLFPPKNFLIPDSYLLFVPIASTAIKLWKEEHWKDLLKKMDKPVLIPWATQEEKARAERLSSNNMAIPLPKLSLSEIGYLIQKADGVVSLDTGLSHIAAALGTPAVSLYGPTDPYLTGTIGENQLWIKEFSLAEITPEQVFHRLKQAILP